MCCARTSSNDWIFQRPDAAAEAPIDEQAKTTGEPQHQADGDESHGHGGERSQRASEPALGRASAAILLDRSSDANAMGVGESPQAHSLQRGIRVGEDHRGVVAGDDL
jgi:hypothetical protein